MSPDGTEDVAASSSPHSADWLDATARAFVVAWNEGTPRPIEAWLAEAPENSREPLCRRLIFEDAKLRLSTGTFPDVAEYRQRFPDVAESIDDLLEVLFSTRSRDASPSGDETTLQLPGSPAPGAANPGGRQEWPGRVLGDYRILARIGGGGMGAVYRALHVYLEREMAVKVVLPDRQGNAGSVERFFREMKAVGRLDHPHIVRCNDAREVDGVPFLVMELLEGRDLQHLVLERGPLPVPIACELIRQAAVGLSHAHEKGLVHRDIKPSNLFLTDAGVLKLLDLGLSILQLSDRSASPDESSHDPTSLLTVEGQALGTPDYMAPEQWNDALNADARADLYGLGATLYFLLSGRPPFVGQGYSTFHGKMRGHLNDTPPALCSLRPDVPIALAGVVDRALSKLPDDRFPTATALADAVSAFLDAESSNVPKWLAGPRQPFVGDRASSACETTAQGTGPAPGSLAKTQIDEDVQFTVYRPKVVLPDDWRPLLVFAHLAERREDAPADEPDPVAEVRRQAEQILGPAVDRFQPSTQESSEAIPRGDTLTFIPTAAGVEFNPPSRSFAWVESVHREEFRFRASRELDGQNARGRVTVYLGQLILAEIPIKFRVDAAHVEPADEPLEPTTGRRFRRIYASFAADDRDIAEEFEGFARLLGDEFMLGCASIRTADIWDDRVRERIRQADVFQLFWSSRALTSPQVEREWQYALGLNRANFIRPVYWEEPLPVDPGRDLPPEALKVCEFQRLVRNIPAPAEPSVRTQESLSRVRSPRVSIDDTLEMNLGAGQVIAGRYRLVHETSRSALGKTWLGESLATEQRVLITELLDINEAILAQIATHARRLAMANDPSLVGIVDVLVENGQSFLVNDFVAGTSLASMISRHGPLSCQQLIPIVASVCAGVWACHAVDLIHGDLKPHNILVLERPHASGRVAKVAGFGLQEVRESRASTNLTFSSPPPVSIPHAAPEVMAGEPPTIRSDVFSIGAILFEALTGTPLASSALDRMVRFREPVPRLSDRNPSAYIPKAVERVVQKCLEFDPSKRYESVDELGVAYRRALDSSAAPTFLPADASAERLAPVPRIFAPSDASAADLLPFPRASAESEWVPPAPLARSATLPPAKTVLRRLAFLGSSMALLFLASLSMVYYSVQSTRTKFYSVHAQVPPPASDPSDIGGKGTAANPKTGAAASPIKPDPVVPKPVVPPPVVPVAPKVEPRVDPPQPVLPPPPPRPLVNPLNLKFAPVPEAGDEKGVPRKIRARLPGSPENARALDLTLVLIEGDDFPMGLDEKLPDIPESEQPRPRHRVELSDFYIQETEVTNAQLTAYFDANGIAADQRPPLWLAAIERLKAAGEDPAPHPAVGVSWELARDFAHWIAPEKAALPTEAQWEFTARSEGENRSQIGKRSPAVGDAAIRLTESDPIKTTARVGSHPRDTTENNVRDMTGNVREWCLDLLAPYAGNRRDAQRDPIASDPTLAIAPLRHVIRGGSFRSIARDNSPYGPRYPVQPQDTLTLNELRKQNAADDVGFRIVIRNPSKAK